PYLSRFASSGCTMKQAIAGVAPSDLGEVSIMTVWPSMAATPVGKFLGRLCLIKAGFGPVLTVGNLMALASIPVAMGVYIFRILPFVGQHYRLTNRRVVVERNYPRDVQKWVALDDFDTIEVVISPGQQWYPAGDLVFRKGPIETLRLAGVLRP